MRVGKMDCPSCLAVVQSQAKACRHCGHHFSAEQLEKQAAFEVITMKRGKIGCGIMAIALLGIGTCTYQSADRPLTAEEVARQKTEQAKDEEEKAKATAITTAWSAVQQRMLNPKSFEYVDMRAVRGKAKDGTRTWIVAVRYRGTNAFGGVMPGNALVTVDQDGNVISIIDVK